MRKIVCAGAAFLALLAPCAADQRMHVVILVSTVADAPLPRRFEQRMLADLTEPLHARLDRVHHAARFAEGRSACAFYPKMDAVFSVETQAALRSDPSRPWPALEKVPSVRWTPRDVAVTMHYSLTVCGDHPAVVASDRLERRYDPMAMREDDAQREGDAIVKTAEVLAVSVSEQWGRAERH